MMATGAASALDIAEGSLRPVSWQDWLTLAVREQDAGVGTARGLVRSPTVLVLARYARMPRRRFHVDGLPAAVQDEHGGSVEGRVHGRWKIKNSTMGVGEGRGGVRSFYTSFRAGPGSGCSRAHPK